MRRTQRWCISFVLDGPSKELRATSRRVEHWRTTKMQERRATTNPYHKEQYISAFVEAQSAASMHRHAVDAKSDALEAVTTREAAHHRLSSDLSALAQELEARYAAESIAPVSVATTSSLSPGVPRTSGVERNAAAPVPFGAWRSAEGCDARLQRRVRSADVVRHCVIREARTPPELSPELLLRSLPPPPRLPAVQRLLTYLDSRSFRAASKPVQTDRFYSSVAAALEGMRYAPPLQRGVALYSVFALSCHRDWRKGADFVLWLQGRWPSLADVSAAQHKTDASHFVALLFDTVRWAAPTKKGEALPTLKDLEDFCEAFQRLLRVGGEDGAASGAEETDNPLWAPVVCAPLLSAIGLREQREGPAPSLTEHVDRLMERYCVHTSLPSSYYHPKKRPAPLAYMPPIAWGEYLRALHRCGADVGAIQSATDRLTDPNRTRQATQLLSSTHVWNAYLACSPGPHAAEVYTNNLRPYGVTATPATTAAVVTALLNENTTEGTSQARVWWDRLCALPPSARMEVRTASTVTVHARLLAAEGDAAAVAALLLSYENLYECFGVPQRWFEKEEQQQQEQRLHRGVPNLGDGVRLLRRACAAHPLLIPPVVQASLIVAAREVEKTANDSSASAATPRAKHDTTGGGLAEASEKGKEAVPELTAEDLAAML